MEQAIAEYVADKMIEEIRLGREISPALCMLVVVLH